MTAPSRSIDRPPVFGCSLVPPPAPLWLSPPCAVVVVTGAVVVVVDPLELLELAVLLDCWLDAVDWAVWLDALLVLELAVLLDPAVEAEEPEEPEEPELLVELELELEPDCVVSLLPPRSPGFAIAKTTPAPSTATISAIKRGVARLFRALTLRGSKGRERDRNLGRERVTGVEPASPAWKAGALPLSYTRGPGGR